jgi:uncharacterized RDD family membrane protein YckC
MSDSRIVPGGDADVRGGFWLRLLAGLIDGIILVVLLLLFLAVADLSAIALTGIGTGPHATGPHDAAGLMAEGSILSGFAAVVLVLLYKIGFEASAIRATPGKLALGLHVAGADGKGLSVAAAAIRAWPWWAPALVLPVDALLGTDTLFSGAAALAAFVSFAVAAFVAGNQGVHDMMAGALVARKTPHLDTAAAAS